MKLNPETVSAFNALNKKITEFIEKVGEQEGYLNPEILELNQLRQEINQKLQKEQPVSGEVLRRFVQVSAIYGKLFESEFEGFSRQIEQAQMSTARPKRPELQRAFKSFENAERILNEELKELSKTDIAEIIVYYKYRLGNMENKVTYYAKVDAVLRNIGGVSALTTDPAAREILNKAGLFMGYLGKSDIPIIPQRSALEQKKATAETNESDHTKKMR